MAINSFQYPFTQSGPTETIPVRQKSWHCVVCLNLFSSMVPWHLSLLSYILVHQVRIVLLFLSCNLFVHSFLVKAKFCSVIRTGWFGYGNERQMEIAAHICFRDCIYLTIFDWFEFKTCCICLIYNEGYFSGYSAFAYIYSD